jgi:hypothetical protein
MGLSLSRTNCSAHAFFLSPNPHVSRCTPSAGVYSWHGSPLCLAALSGQPSKPAGFAPLLRREGLTAKARAEQQWGIAIAPLRSLVRVAVAARDDLRRACQVVARFGATTLYSVDPHGIRTMMHSCASTARLLGGGPILTSGIEAMEFSGLPATSDHLGVTRAEILSVVCCFCQTIHAAGRRTTPAGISPVVT